MAVLQWASVLAGLTAIVLLGWLLIATLAPSSTSAERAGLCFGAGTGAAAVLMFLLSLVRVPLAFWPVFVSLLVTAVLLAVLARHRLGSLRSVLSGRARPSSASSRSLPTRVILGAIVAVILLNAALNLYWPPVMWDALARYDLIARLVHRERTLQVQALVEPDHTDLRVSYRYPPLFPLTLCCAYVLGAPQAKLVLTGFYLSLLLVFWSVVRPRTSPVIASAFTLLLASTPVVFRYAAVAYASFPAFYYDTGAVLYLCSFAATSRTDELNLAALLFMFAAWTRPEAGVYWVLSLVAVMPFLTRKHAVSALTKLVLPTLALTLAWHAYIAQIAPTTMPYFKMERVREVDWQWLGTVLAYFGRFVAGPELFGVTLWVALAVCVVSKASISPGGQRTRVAPLLAQVGAIALGWVAIFYLTGGEPGSRKGGPDLEDGGDRLLMYIIPPLLFIAGTRALWRRPPQ